MYAYNHRLMTNEQPLINPIFTFGFGINLALDLLILLYYLQNELDHENVWETLSSVCLSIEPNTFFAHANDFRKPLITLMSRFNKFMDYLHVVNQVQVVFKDSVPFNIFTSEEERGMSMIARTEGCLNETYCGSAKDWLCQCLLNGFVHPINRQFIVGFGTAELLNHSLLRPTVVRNLPKGLAYFSNLEQLAVEHVSNVAIAYNDVVRFETIYKIPEERKFSRFLEPIAMPYYFEAHEHPDGIIDENLQFLEDVLLHNIVQSLPNTAAQATAFENQHASFTTVDQHVTNNVDQNQLDQDQEQFESSILSQESFYDPGGPQHIYLGPGQQDVISPSQQMFLGPANSPLGSQQSVISLYYNTNNFELQQEMPLYSLQLLVEPDSQPNSPANLPSTA